MLVVWSGAEPGEGQQADLQHRVMMGVEAHRELWDY